MADLARLPLTFEDVAIYFSEQEWQHLQTWQKTLYKHVMRTNYETLASLDSNLSKPELILWIERGREPFWSWEESQTPEHGKYSPAQTHFDPVTEQQLLGDPLQGHDSSGTFTGEREDISFRAEPGLSLLTPRRLGTLALAAVADGSSLSAPEGLPSLQEGLPSWQSLPGSHRLCGESFGKENHLGPQLVCRSGDPPGSAGPAEAWGLAEALGPGPRPACGRSPQGKPDFPGRLASHGGKSPVQGPKCHACFHPDQPFSCAPLPGPEPSGDPLSTVRPQDSPRWTKGPASRRGSGGAPPGGEPRGRGSGRLPKDQQPFRPRSQLRARPFPCSECGRAFAQQSRLRQHLRRHSGERPFQCPECPKSFRVQGVLRAHLHTHSAHRPFPCGQCGKGFVRQSQLTEHLRLHSGERPFACPQCPRAFRLKGQLRSHLRLHTGERPFQCPDCGKSYRVKADMKAHQLLHGAKMPFSCQCGKGFAKRYKLVEHVRIHTGEKPFQCAKCDKTFRLKAQLLSHQRLHTGERPFHCPECDRDYRERSHLLRHQRIHRPERPFACGDCGKGFIYKSKLAAHVRVHSKSCPAPREPDRKRLRQLFAMIEADWS